MAERIRVARVAEILGLTIRTVQMKAARGEIPSAAQIGRAWTFREAAVREWVADLEAATARDVEMNKRAIAGARSRSIPVLFSHRGDLAQAYDRALYPKGRNNPIYHRRPKRKHP